MERKIHGGEKERDQDTGEKRRAEKLKKGPSDIFREHFVVGNG